MRPLMFKSDPVFDIKQDLARIRSAVSDQHNASVSADTLLFPTSRAYIVTDKFVPVAIFDKLGPAFGALLKLSLVDIPGDVDNKEGSLYLDTLDTLRRMVHARGVKRPYTVAVFIADSVCFHFKIPVEALIVFCDRLQDHDIIDREIWEILYDYGMDEPCLDTDSDGD